MQRKEKIVVSSNYAWTIVNFRIQLIKDLVQQGYRVEVITQFDGHETEIYKHAHNVHNLYISRKGMNPFQDIITMLHYYILFVKIRPAIAVLYTIKPNIYGSIAARISGVRSIVTITGLGTAILSGKLLNWITNFMYKISLRKSSAVYFQNRSDRNFFIKNQIVAADITKLVNGSGIDLKKFSGSPCEEVLNTRFTLVARMIEQKGISEYVTAAKIVKQKYPNTIFELLGPIDVENISAISKEEIDAWENAGIIRFLGEVDDVIPIINKSDCVVLPSHREGLSRVLLEAAAMSRPIIATNVPGCRELVKDGVNGFLCEVKNPHSLAQKMFDFISLDHRKKLQMGVNSRVLVQTKYDIRLVNKVYLDQISSILGCSN